MSDPVLAHLEADRDQVLARLTALLREPSVSTDPTYGEGLAGARAMLRERLEQVGFEDVRALEAGGHPALFAQRLDAPGRPTLLVYGHYDVQPPDPLDRWLSPPFEPTVRSGRLYARGASDDKGPLSIALEVLAAFLHVEGHLPVNVKLLIEGEEELGSATLEAICREHRALLAADAVLSADGARWRTDLATVNVGMRGSGGFEVKVRTAAKDLHSGRYGGAVPNALHVMSRLIASLHGPDGEVRVPGFLDGVELAGEAERARLAAIPFDEDAFACDLGTRLTGEPGFTTLERLWLRPTVEVNGLWGGYTGPGAKTVIPSEAHAKITLRLAPGQDPARAQRQVIDHLHAQCPDGAAIEVTGTRTATPACTVPGDHPLLTAVEDTLEATLGARPLRVRIGATLPLADIARRALGIDTVTFSFSTADEDFHAPNEFFRLASLDQGIAAWVDLLRRLGAQHADQYERFRAG